MKMLWKRITQPYDHYLCHDVLWGHDNHYPCAAAPLNRAGQTMVSVPLSPGTSITKNSEGLSLEMWLLPQNSDNKRGQGGKLRGGGESTVTVSLPICLQVFKRERS